MLTELKIKAADRSGMYADGAGLYLQVKQGSSSAVRQSKSWIYRFQLNGRRREMGLGSLADVSAKEARRLAADARRHVLDGVDPLDLRQRLALEAALANSQASVNPVTFKDVALDYINRHKTGWRSDKHTQQWENTLSTYAFPTLGDIPVADVDDELVLEVLRPIWLSRTETATRVRSRIEIVLDAARANKLRMGDNPARWKGHLALLLPKPRKVTPVKHRPALRFVEASRFLADLRRHSGASALCLDLLMLTAVRSSEALQARWVEFDRSEAIWTIPASRTKTGKEHRVPLSEAAIAVVDKAAMQRQGDYVFPGIRSGRPMSDMALTMLVRGMRRKDGTSWCDADGRGITVHGFRSTFRDWVAEKTTYANELAEMALGHAVGDAVEAAYRRGDMFERRRQLMEDWAAWCTCD